MTITSVFVFSKNTEEVIPEQKKEEIQEKIRQHQTSSKAYFEINTGQFQGELLYRFGNAHANVDFFKDRVEFSLRKMINTLDPMNPEWRPEFDYTKWSISFEASSSMNIQHEGESILKGVTTFKASHVGRKTLTAQKVIYEGIFPNIDMVFYLNGEHELKYDFILHPGATISDLKLEYQGVDDLKVEEDGSLSYDTKWGEVTEDIPYSYLQASGKEVKFGYVVEGRQLRFNSELGKITETVVLDPIYIDWSSYFYGEGKSGTTWNFTYVMDLDVDDSNNVYVVGTTNDRFPMPTVTYDTSPGAQFYEGYVCKLGPKCDSVLWFTYIGGSSWEWCKNITVNSLQQPVISGFTWSNDYPTTPGAYDTIGTSGWPAYFKCFITKFSKAGDSLVFSTYLGGSSSDLVNTMVMDASGNVFVAGETSSQDFPTTSGAYQTAYGGGGVAGYYAGAEGFFAKISSDGKKLLYSSFVGGAGVDQIKNMAFSPSGELYLVGKTNSSNFYATPGSRIVFNATPKGGSYDGFVMKIKTDLKSLVYSNLMGGDGDDWFEGIYVNSQDEAYVAGVSSSSNFYTSARAYQKTNKGGFDLVVVKLNKLGQNVYYSTYLGGSSDELFYNFSFYNVNVRVAANVREEAMIIGISRSTNFPTTSDALYKTNPSNAVGGWWNSSAVVCKLDYTGERLLYSTYFGGSNFEYPMAIKLRRYSCFTSVLYGGFTRSDDYPTSKGVFREVAPVGAGGFFWSGFISKFRDTLYTDLIQLASQDTVFECDNVFEILDAKNIGADILWSTGGTKRFEIIEDTGTYWVYATYGCDTTWDTITFIKEYSPVVPVLPSDSTYCDTFPQLTLDAGNDSMLATYVWSTGDSSKTIDISSAGKYWVRIETPHCLNKTDTVRYKLLKTPKVSIPPDTLFCDSINLILSSGIPNNEEDYLWNTGDSVNTLAVTDTGQYQLRISNFCGADSMTSHVRMYVTPRAILPSDTIFCDQVDFSYKHPAGGSNGETYLWHDLINAQVISRKDSVHITKEGRYLFEITNACAVISDSIALGLRVTPTVDLGNDSIFCDNIQYLMVPGLTGNDETYLWDDGSTKGFRAVSSEGKYWVNVKNLCGEVSDTIRFVKRITPNALIMHKGSEMQDSVFCDVLNVNLYATPGYSDYTYKWHNGSTDSIFNAKNIGFHWLEVKGHCGVSRDSVYLDLINSPSIELGPERVYCGALIPFNLDVYTANNSENYLWENGSQAAQRQVIDSGLVWVDISNKCGSVRDSLIVRVSPYPVVNLGEDTSLCGNFTLRLDAGNPGMSYLWSPYGETTQTIEVNEQRVYTVTVTNSDGCATTDDFEVTGDCISYINIPNAFTPNGVGPRENETFKPVLVNYESFNMKIYSRWGELLFESDDPNIGWDGTYNGVDVQQGAYLYSISFVTTEDMRLRHVEGMLILLR